MGNVPGDDLHHHFCQKGGSARPERRPWITRSGSIAASISWVVLDTVGVVSCRIDSALNVAALGHRPLVVLLQQDRPNEPNHRGGIREDVDDVRPPLDLPVEAFERVRAGQFSLDTRAGDSGRPGCPRRPSAVASSPEAWSCCAKIVRTTAAIASRTPCGTVASRFRMKCPRHRCHAEPVKTVLIAYCSPSCASEMTRRALVSLRLTKLRKNAVQKVHPDSWLVYHAVCIVRLP